MFIFFRSAESFPSSDAADVKAEPPKPEINLDPERDSRLREVRIEETASDVSAADSAEHPAEKEASGEEKDPESERTESAANRSKKKGKGGGNRGGGQRYGGGNKKEDKSWDDPEKVHSAVERWEREIDALDLDIEKQKADEADAENASPALLKLEERKAILEKRREKGNARIQIGKKKKEIQEFEQDLLAVLNRIREAKKSSKGDVSEKEALQQKLQIAKQDLADMMEGYVRDYQGVSFEDDPDDRDPSPPLEVDSSPVSKTSSKIKKAAAGTALVGGGIVVSTGIMGGGLLKDLFRSWRGFVSNSSKMFGGWKFKDFFWRSDHKKK